MSLHLYMQIRIYGMIAIKRLSRRDWMTQTQTDTTIGHGMAVNKN